MEVLLEGVATRRVGAVAIAVIVAAIGFFVFVWDGIEWGSNVRVDVVFAGTGGLREGAAVVVAGREIGRVESIALAPDGVRVRLAIERAVAARIRRGGDVFVSGRGTFSERYVELGPAPAGATATLADADPTPIRGSDPPMLDRVLQRMWDNLTAFRAFTLSIAPELASLQLQLRTLAARFDELGLPPIAADVDAVIAEARTLRDVGLGGEPGLVRVAAVIDRAAVVGRSGRAALAALDARLAAARTGLADVRGRFATADLAKLAVAIDHARAAFAKVDPLLAKLEDLADRLRRGDGSLGKLANDPEFPEDAREIGKILKREPWRLFGRPADEVKRSR